MKTAEQVELSVIIPTYNRCDMLRQTLESLTQQRYSPDRFEVIVADDGSSDQTVEVAHSFGDRLRLKYCFQEDLGFRAAAARNAGARLASAPVLAFLDTGTLAGPGFVRAHLQAHDGPGKRAVIGYCYGYRLETEMDWLTAALAEDGPAGAVQRFGADPAFHDLREDEFAQAGDELSGLAAPWIYYWSMNCSVNARGFWEAGGFDENYTAWGGEDVELGYRLCRHGLAFLMSRDAWTVEIPHPCRLKGNRQGLKRNTLRFLQKHPEPLIEIFCDAHLRDTPVLMEAASRSLARWKREAAQSDPALEIEKTLQDIPAGETIAVFGCGAHVPPSLPPSILADFDAELLAVALADGRHTGYQLIGIRTPLRIRSVGTVIVTSRLRCLWEEWGERVLAEAHRVGRCVRVPFLSS